MAMGCLKNDIISVQAAHHIQYQSKNISFVIFTTQLNGGGGCVNTPVLKGLTNIERTC